MNTILIISTAALLGALVVTILVSKRRLKSKDLVHLRILKEHLDLYKDCIDAGEIETLKSFIFSTSRAIDDSINTLSKSSL